MNTPIKHVVFDIGKVLIHYDPELGYHDIIPDPAERRWFLDNVCTSAWNIEQDRGRSWLDGEAALIEQYPSREREILAFRQNWPLMVSHAYEDSVVILRKLIASGIDVTMLTNFASDTFREAQARYPFLQESRGVTVSGDIRLLKPDLEIYQHHATTFELEPSATLFIDDAPANVEGARAAGWHSVQFIDAPTLASDLHQMGVYF